MAVQLFLSWDVGRRCWWGYVQPTEVLCKSVPVDALQVFRERMGNGLPLAHLLLLHPSENTQGG